MLKKGNNIIAFECKVADAHKPTKSFWQSIYDVRPDVSYIVAPIVEKYPIKENVWVIGIKELIRELL